MSGAIATKLECPRCGESVPSWQPVHVRCFVYRIRAVVWVVAAAVMIPVAIWGFRTASMVYERSRVSVVAVGSPEEQQSSTAPPPVTARSADDGQLRGPVKQKPAATAPDRKSVV